MSYLGQYFTYNGINSELYGLYFAKLDVSENFKIGGDVEYINFKNKKSPITNIQDFNYTTPLSFDAEIVTETKIDNTDFQTITNWLFNQTTYKKLYINDDSTENKYFNCVFTNVEVIEKSYENQGYGIYGFKFTINCDSSFMWQDEKTFKYTSFSSTPISPSTPTTSKTIYINNTSQMRGYTYPTLTIKTGSSFNPPCSWFIQITNKTDNNRITSINGITTPSTPTDNDTIVLSINPYSITSVKNTDSDFVFSHFNKNWFRLLQGINEILIETEEIPITEIQIKYQDARLVNFNDS